jgi:hypothetical protein
LSPENPLPLVKSEIVETITLFNFFARYAAFLWCVLQENKSSLINFQEIFVYRNKHF